MLKFGKHIEEIFFQCSEKDLHTIVSCTCGPTEAMSKMVDCILQVVTMALHGEDSTAHAEVEVVSHKFQPDLPNIILASLEM